MSPFAHTAQAGGPALPGAPGLLSGGVPEPASAPAPTVGERPLDGLLGQVGTARWRWRDRRLLAVLIVLLGWSTLAQVDRVVSSQGKVVPYDKVKVIQHLEGGLVKQLVVREGQTVKAGDPLIELDLATTGFNGAEMSTRMGSFRFARARLEAEARGTDQFTLALTERDPQLQASAGAEQATFRARREELRSTLAAIDGQIAQGRQRVAELNARLQSAEASLRIAQHELALSDNLFRDKLVSEIEHLQRRSNVERLSGDIAATRQAIPGAQANVDEAMARRREEEAKFRRRASDELAELERKIASLGEELNRARDQERRAVIRAPIDGVVKNVKFQAAGNVVKAGEPIMELVPDKEQLVIELRLNPADRGHLQVGQKALVKISAYDYYRYGGLDGQVQSIAADTDVGRNEEQFYRVIVATDRAHLGATAAEMPISPGMTGEVDVRVDSSSVLWALLRPILKFKQEALREV
ncbi:HlyD family type I secretion periplasmic adaptor subunit [Ideonella livida]|uniref:Membrane fusion protein (MFP) family protein n=1 Tax=Ideonella livida TaxID=2707176 RepID=A0A7C9PFT8_9BURK|nr:HlyD family type I secretion periplasmic adaptor subunit [Ideonella livida]NDY90857.1 HlyD family type I secretion periplasmic adaptor subunit [Ideonella livida]